MFALIKEKWSPIQVSERLSIDGGLWISHETIYRMIKEDKKEGGVIFKHPRHSMKKRLFIKEHGRKSVKTITSDNGNKFHGYIEIERITGTTFYFAHPYHSWERGTNENTNGLIR